MLCGRIVSDFVYEVVLNQVIDIAFIVFAIDLFKHRGIKEEAVSFITELNGTFIQKVHQVSGFQ